MITNSHQLDYHALMPIKVEEKREEEKALKPQCVKRKRVCKPAPIKIKEVAGSQTADYWASVQAESNPPACAVNSSGPGQNTKWTARKGGCDW
jgi:hypothetical protein